MRSVQAERVRRGFRRDSGSLRRSDVLQDGGKGKPMKDSATVTKIQHTPGPWTVSEDPDTNGVFIIREILASEVLDASPTGVDADLLYEEQNKLRTANARLIAAAPEMLEALKSVSEAYQSMFDVMPVAWQTFDNIVNEAIAKAGGSR
jgi:hypothetical protein